MWFSYVVAIVVGVALSFVPGYLALRCIRLGRVASLCAAPLATYGIYGILALVYGFCGVFCSCLSLAAAPSALFLCALLVSNTVGRRRAGAEEARDRDADEDATTQDSWFEARTGFLVLATSVLAGIVICAVVFCCNLGNPDSFAQNYDNAWHLWHIYHIAGTGIHSSLTSVFYPSVYHSLCALVQTSSSVSNICAENAVNFVLPAFVFPANVVLLASQLFPESPRKTLLSGVLCLSIAFFPWRIMLFGPLYPNVMAFSVMPVEAVAFIRATLPHTTPKDRLRWAALFVLGGMGLALIHPNSVFSTGVYLIPYLIHSTGTLVAERTHGRKGARVLPVVAACAMLLVIACVWVALYRAPFMQSVVGYGRDAPNLPIQALKWALALCYTRRRQQYLLGCIVVLGTALMLRKPGRRWAGISYVLLVALYVVAFGVGGEAKGLLTGFWYCDYNRLAAAACAFAAPSIAEGVDALAHGASLALSALRKTGDANRSATTAPAVTCLVTALVVLLNFFPLPFIPKSVRSFAFDTVSQEFSSVYGDPDWLYLDDAEVAFLNEVHDVVPEGERVLNQPHDGSVFAASVADVPVTFNFFFEARDNSDGWKAVREGLCDYTSNPDVAAQLEERGAHYLLQLDQGNSIYGMNARGTLYTLGYEGVDWEGINSVRDDTPGFEVVLSEGDMRLYRITG